MRPTQRKVAAKNMLEVSGIYCIIAFETAMRQQNFAKQN